VAWLDADVIFEGGDWARETYRLLDDYPLVQPFETVYELGPDGVAPERSRAFRSGHSLMAMIAGGVPATQLLSGNMRVDYRCHAGLAWAARRDFLRDTRFYDVCILGSGNRAMASAALGYFNEAQEFLAMNPCQQAHYLPWAEHCYDNVRGRIGYVRGGGIFHLWHGRLEDRRYGQRHRGLQRFDFDPRHDIAPAPGGAWSWNSDKPDMHQYVLNYFPMRKEDG
jgi:hypothetical protein